MKRVLALFLVLICMLSIVACDKATSSEEPVIDGGVSDVSEIDINVSGETEQTQHCLLYTSPSPRDRQKSRMPSSA